MYRESASETIAAPMRTKSVMSCKASHTKRNIDFGGFWGITFVPYNWRCFSASDSFNPIRKTLEYCWNSLIYLVWCLEVSITKLQSQVKYFGNLICCHYRPILHHYTQLIKNRTLTCMVVFENKYHFENMTTCYWRTREGLDQTSVSIKLSFNKLCCLFSPQSHQKLQCL